MKTLVRLASVAFLLVVVLPSLAQAQASIAGVVKDTSGAVLPGVTVEAASPALIERVRSVVTDGSGQYKIVDLRPGTYTVTFGLVGFNTVRRAGIELAGTFAATVNADLMVGAVQETITVSGTSPVVDVQNAKQQTVLSKEIIDAIPTGRTTFDLAALVPSVVSTIQDTGGTVGTGNLPTLTVHGSKAGDMRVLFEGMSIQSLESNGQSSAYVPNTGSTQETVVDTSGISAEASQTGVRINTIPKEGGNNYSGTFFGTGTNGSFQGSNYTQDLINRGLKSPNSIKKLYEINPGFGGPLQQDKLWMYFSARRIIADNWIGNMWYNANFGQPGSQGWLYAADLNRPANNRSYQRSINGHFTYQATPKNKITVFYDDQTRCAGCPSASATAAPDDRQLSNRWAAQRLADVTWSAPVTNRLLFEAASMNRLEGWHNASDSNLADIDVTDQASGITYHGVPVNGGGGSPFYSFATLVTNARASLTYVTGAHAFKVGFTDLWGTRDQFIQDNLSGLSYRFNNGIPNQINERATGFTALNRLKADLGIFAQDKWTVRHLTMNLGVRYDYFNDYFAPQTLGPAPLAPNRNTTFPLTPFVHWDDISPRVGIAYDVFGNGKTAFTASVGRYVTGQTLNGTFGSGANPIYLTATSVTRSWADANKNFIPDCNLLQPTANGECGVMSNVNFGLPVASATYDPTTYTGWGHRGYNWEFSAGVQHELVSRVAVGVSYFRRIYGNFVVTDNLSVAPSDYSPYSVTAPVNAALPGGGGNTIPGFLDLNPPKVGLVNNYITLSDNYGAQTDHWNGMDINFSARAKAGVTIQGGMSTGREVTDNCAILAALPETSPLGVPYCHQVPIWSTQGRFSATYMIPKIGVQSSASFQSVPGPNVAANFVATNAQIAPSLGRSLSGNAANATVGLISPGAVHGDRLNQTDLRFGKILKFGRTKTAANVDLYNIFNTTAVLAENAAYASFRVPTSTLAARFVKFSVQFDF